MALGAGGRGDRGAVRDVPDRLAGLRDHRAHRRDRVPRHGGRVALHRAPVPPIESGRSNPLTFRQPLGTESPGINTVHELLFRPSCFRECPADRRPARAGSQTNPAPSLTARRSDGPGWRTCRPTPRRSPTQLE
ncbi:protein of unknown function [Methylorubrum extorquens]|uniref:Uncharacterized protein n=1 Tax=Methylorubrum extorquens TaxID=408 RepID=A0A2N9AQD8_METEX|nr:protein of unknown function [Methylorubrum extorquens]